jgi:hypothetical protein
MSKSNVADGDLQLLGLLDVLLAPVVDKDDVQHTIFRGLQYLQVSQRTKFVKYLTYFESVISFTARKVLEVIISLKDSSVSIIWKRSPTFHTRCRELFPPAKKTGDWNLVVLFFEWFLYTYVRDFVG